MPLLRELQEQRAKLIADARATNDSAERENRALSAEESANFERAMTDAEALKGRIEQQARLEAEERQLASSPGRVTSPSRPGEAEQQPPPTEFRYRLPSGRERIIPLVGPTAAGEYRAAFNRALIGGNRALSEAEFRALQADNDAEGGYLNAPQDFIARLIQGVDNAVILRQLATVLSTVSNEGLGAPSLDTDMAAADWTSELLTGAEDTSLRFGKRELKPWPLAKRVKVSKKLLRTAALPIEDIIRQRLTYQFAVTQENAFLNGSGAGQPLGVFTASNDGIGTARDVSTGNTTTAITFDGLKEAKWTLKGQYWGAAAWIFHRDAGKMIDKLKDGEGRYLWEPSVVVGQPDRLLNLPYYLSEYAPNTFTTGLYVGILGDFSNYWIADALTLTIQVLTELYAETNQNGYIARLECDAMPVLAEAFVRVKLA